MADLADKTGPQASQAGRQTTLVASLLLTVGALCVWIVATSSASTGLPTPPPGPSHKQLLSELARIKGLLQQTRMLMKDSEANNTAPANAPLTAPVAGEGYVQPQVLFGHVHMAKTGWTCLNGNLSMHFERICGHKGYSYDAFLVNERHCQGSNYVDSVASQTRTYSRQRVPAPLMREIGFEDCDWVSHEISWQFWKQLRSLDTPLELHVPCRDPLDHLMSQCNHRQKTFSCAADPAEEANQCLLYMTRFSKQLLALANTTVKCFDWRAAYDGRYFDYMEGRLQRRRKEARYKRLSTNRDRMKAAECVWNDDSTRKKVLSHLLTLEYYSFCDSCMGSPQDLFQPKTKPKRPGKLYK